MGTIILAKLQLLLRVVLDQNTHLNATIQVAFKRLDLASPGRPFARRELHRQCSLQCPDFGLATVHFIARSDLQTLPSAAPRFEVEGQDSRSRHVEFWPVRHDPQGTLGVARQLRKVVMQWSVGLGGIPQGENATPIREFMHQAQLTMKDAGQA